MLNFARTSRYLALVVSAAALGCHAQTPAQPAASSPSAIQPVQVGVKIAPEMARRIEVMIRSKSDVPAEYTIGIGEPTKSDFTGYDQIIVTFTADGKTSRPLPFLISSDGKTLAQFNRFDLSADPKDKVSAAGRPSRGGPANAPVLIVGFDDLECPYCAKMNAMLFPQILNRYKDQVRIVYRDFPLSDIHPWAMHAAVDANCIGLSSTTGYWNFVDYVHAHSDEIAGKEQTAAKAFENLDKFVMDEGARQKVNPADLEACVKKQDDTKVITSRLEAEAEPLHVDSTPILYVNGEKVEGVVPVETLYRIIDRALIAAGQTPPPLPPPPPATPAAPAPAANKPGS